MQCHAIKIAQKLSFYNSFKNNSVSLETTVAIPTTVSIPSGGLLSAAVLSTIALIVAVFGIVTNAVVLVVLILARRRLMVT